MNCFFHPLLDPAKADGSDWLDNPPVMKGILSIVLQNNTRFMRTGSPMANEMACNGQAAYRHGDWRSTTGVDEHGRSASN
jgi:hypothetical protein